MLKAIDLLIDLLPEILELGLEELNLLLSIIDEIWLVPKLCDVQVLPLSDLSLLLVAKDLVPLPADHSPFVQTLFSDVEDPVDHDFLLIDLLLCKLSFA